VAVLDAATRAINTFTELFGPYQHLSLSIVESPFFDGMEYDGLFFLSQDYYKTYDGKLLGNLADLTVHETAHQWWFGQVGNDQAMEPWLDEALATYSEELFYEKNIPNVSAWWVFRVESFSPSGWVDMDIYHGINFRTYANAVYLRGAQFLEDLRKIIGDDAFFAFLIDYSTTMSGKLATSKDFFRILGTHSTANISNLISSYFQRSK
jgi:aminopeptidase N